MENVGQANYAVSKRTLIVPPLSNHDELATDKHNPTVLAFPGPFTSHDLLTEIYKPISNDMLPGNFGLEELIGNTIRQAKGGKHFKTTNAPVYAVRQWSPKDGHYIMWVVGDR